MRRGLRLLRLHLRGPEAALCGGPTLGRASGSSLLPPRARSRRGRDTRTVPAELPCGAQLYPPETARQGQFPCEGNTIAPRLVEAADRKTWQFCACRVVSRSIMLLITSRSLILVFAAIPSVAYVPHFPYGSVCRGLTGAHWIQGVKTCPWPPRWRYFPLCKISTGCWSCVCWSELCRNNSFL